MELSRLPPRVVVALVVTVAALAVLGVRALATGDGDEGSAVGSSSTTASTTTVAARESPTTTSIEILADWFPKQTSRYSEREPVVSLTTVPTTSSTVPDGDGSAGDGSAP